MLLFRLSIHSVELSTSQLLKVFLLKLHFEYYRILHAYCICNLHLVILLISEIFMGKVVELLAYLRYVYENR